MLRAHSVSKRDSEPDDWITLSREDRFRRRIQLTADNGLSFLLDLARAVELKDGDDLVLDDGRHVRVRAAEEKLMRLTVDDPAELPRLAWHIGNRHLPCEIHDDHLVLQHDHVIADMLTRLGGHVEEISAPFNPEGGAYGQGRTHSHHHHHEGHTHEHDTPGEL